MAAFVELHLKNRKVLLNLDQVCVIEEQPENSDVLIRCSNSEDYVIVGQEAERLLACVQKHRCPAI